MVEIKRAQNLNSKKQQNAQAQDAARGRGTKPQLNGRSNRFNVGRGAAPQGPLPPRGAAAHRGGAMGTRTVVGAGAAVHAKYQGGKAPGVWRQPNKPMPPSWTPLPHGGRGGRGGGNSAAAPHLMGPEAYGAQADGVPGGRHGPPPGWFPGVPQEQMMGYYVYPMYPGAWRVRGKHDARREREGDRERERESGSESESECESESESESESEYIHIHRQKRLAKPGKPDEQLTHMFP